MNILFILFLILIIIIILNYNNNEYFNNILPSSTCLITKEYVPELTNELGGDFKYVYKKVDDLEINNYSSNNQQIIDCNSDHNSIGSCRRSNKECIDFVDNNFCKKYKGMIWSNKTCNNNIFT